MCSKTNSCGINEARAGSSIDFSANTVAHEMGHNFNSRHDSSGNSCPSSGFIMAASSCSNCGNVATEFSSCSISSINGLLPSATCLDNVPTILYPDSDPCGNYVVDEGEECDAGPSGSFCCDGKEAGNNKCQWKSGAECEDSQSPCCSGCQLRPTSYTCRASSGPCDPEDKCQADVCSLFQSILFFFFLSFPFPYPFSFIFFGFIF